MGLFERYLSVWIGLAIVVGVGLGAWFPDAAASIAALEAAGINLPIAVLIWGMIFPMMLAVDFSSIGAIRHQPRGLLVIAVVNWLIKPFTMTALAWIPIPLQALEPCIPSRAVRRRQKRPWFSRIELLLPPGHTAPLAIA